MKPEVESLQVRIKRLEERADESDKLIESHRMVLTGLLKMP